MYPYFSVHGCDFRASWLVFAWSLENPVLEVIHFSYACVFGFPLR